MMNASPNVDPLKTSNIDHPITTDIDRLIASAVPKNTDFVYPPKIVEAMGGEFLEYVPGCMIKARFPVLESYQNPMANMQGGMILAAIDNAMGPLCLLEAGPCVTTHLNSTFLRPVTAACEFIDVVVEIMERSKRFLHLKGDALTPEGKVVVTTMATFTLSGR
jgi:acyl-coenzyme A thioesterase PaaI-like protein